MIALSFIGLLFLIYGLLARVEKLEEKVRNMESKLCSID